jgi:hypothetical protein
MQYDSQKDGIWLIAGDSGKRISKFQLYFYNLKEQKASLIRENLDLGYCEGITLVNNNGKKFLFCVEDNGKKPNKAANYMLMNLDEL